MRTCSIHLHVNGKNRASARLVDATTQATILHSHEREYLSVFLDRVRRYKETHIVQWAETINPFSTIDSREWTLHLFPTQNEKEPCLLFLHPTTRTEWIHFTNGGIHYLITTKRKKGLIKEVTHYGNREEVVSFLQTELKKESLRHLVRDQG